MVYIIHPHTKTWDSILLVQIFMYILWNIMQVPGYVPNLHLPFFIESLKIILVYSKNQLIRILES